VVEKGIHQVPKRNDTAYGSRRGGRDDALKPHTKSRKFAGWGHARRAAPNLAETIRFPAIPGKTRKNCDWFAAAYPVKR
jgi:hypothetical protein